MKSDGIIFGQETRGIKKSDWTDRVDPAWDQEMKLI
jgi:hypothetical protein